MAISPAEKVGQQIETAVSFSAHTVKIQLSRQLCIRQLCIRQGKKSGTKKHAVGLRRWLIASLGTICPPLMSK